MRIAMIAAVVLGVACKRHEVPAQAEDAAKKTAFVHAAARSGEPLPSGAVGVWVTNDGVRASVDGPLLARFVRDETPAGGGSLDTSELEPAIEKLARQVDAADAELAFHVDAHAERAIVSAVLSVAARVTSRSVWLAVGDGSRGIPLRGVPASPGDKAIPHQGLTLSDDPQTKAWQLKMLAGVDAGPAPSAKPSVSAAPSASAAPSCGSAPLAASITVEDAGYSVNGFGVRLGPDCTHAGTGVTVPARDGKLDDEALAQCLVRLKACSASYASETTATIDVRDKRDFQSAVRALDAIRPSFATIRVRAAY